MKAPTLSWTKSKARRLAISPLASNCTETRHAKRQRESTTARPNPSTRDTSEERLQAVGLVEIGGTRGKPIGGMTTHLLPQLGSETEAATTPSTDNLADQARTGHRGIGLVPCCFA
mmetsp:Transcript_26396/g.73819  ORF Transcript_26396/g.73819 Transcript_26396/m.73819 type:complete len:116 (+) Transcript_26396:590-937(+)